MLFVVPDQPLEVPLFFFCSGIVTAWEESHCTHSNPRHERQGHMHILCVQSHVPCVPHPLHTDCSKNDENLMVQCCALFQSIAVYEFARPEFQHFAQSRLGRTLDIFRSQTGKKLKTFWPNPTYAASSPRRVILLSSTPFPSSGGGVWIRSRVECMERCREANGKMQVTLVEGYKAKS